jgi:UDP-N-acetylmuramoylalanine--D-glutamate ligase
MKVAILGYGVQGKTSYDYWVQAGNEVVIHDRNEAVQLPPNAKAILGGAYLKNLDEYDLLVRAPSLHPNDIVAANGEAILKNVTSNTNEFFKTVPTKNIIGVTGTKGKGTTSTLIAKMLEAIGKKVHLGGNIGTPPLDLLNPPAGGNIQPGDWVVLELANFQLIDLKQSPHIAVCLMVAPEHLDWHKSMDEYISTKQQMFAHQLGNDIAIYYALSEYSQHIASVSKGRKVPYMKHPGADVIESKVVIDGNEICSVNELKLLGEHNWQNVCAAVTAVWQVTQDIPAIKSVLTSFAGLEHRLELVKEVNNVKYYDDSFGTTPETAIVAIKAFKKPKVIILGGSDKGAKYDELAQTVKDNDVRSAIIIGETGDAIKSALQNAGFAAVTEGGTTMDEIVRAAKNAAKPGDVVLLSTGCASFGLFKNYKDRGEQFKTAVQALV